jgi:hypothetical protein
VREVHLQVAQTISDAPIYADADGIVDPELGEWRCPNGHDSSIPPKLPELMFKACGHSRLEGSGRQARLIAELLQFRVLRLASFRMGFKSLTARAHSCGINGSASLSEEPFPKVETQHSLRRDLKALGGDER